MKNVAWLFFALGVVVMLLGIYGRMHGAWDIGVSFLGQRFSGSAFLLLANSFLLIGVFLGLAELQSKR
jgi:hypothetical protein